MLILSFFEDASREVSDGAEFSTIFTFFLKGFKMKEKRVVKMGGGVM